MAAMSLAWNVWTYFQARKTAEIRFEVSELADFKIPGEFLTALSYAPLVIRIESTGNKAAENVILDIATNNAIEKCEVEPSILQPNLTPNRIRLSIDTLNPAQSVRMFVTCVGDPSSKQLSRIELTQKEGQVLPYNHENKPSDYHFAEPGESISIFAEHRTKKDHQQENQYSCEHLEKN
jgi:hypothetical protein